MLPILRLLIKTYLFILPWQTVWIVRERYLNGYKWQYGTEQFFLAEAIAWLVFLVFFWWFGKKALRASREKKIKFSWSPDRVFILFVLIFLLYSFLSIVWSPSQEISWQQSFRLLEAALLFFVIQLGPVSKKEIISWLLLGSIFPAILGIAQFGAQATWSASWLGLSAHLPSEAGTAIVSGAGRWLRAYGPFAHPNIFGGYLATALILLFYFISDNPITKSGWKIVLSLFTIIVSGALFFSFSRSAMAMLVVAIAIFVGFGLRQKTLTKDFVIYLSMPILIFLIGGIIYSPLVKTRLAGIAVSETTSIQERVSGYVEAGQMIAKDPWLGAGSGNFTVAAYLLDKTRPGWEYQPTHNVALLYTAELGLVGVIIFCGLSASFVGYFLTVKSKENGYLELFLLIPLIPVLAVDHYFWSLTVGLSILSIYIGIILRPAVHS